jgi:hypothetical protein
VGAPRGIGMAGGSEPLHGRAARASLASVEDSFDQGPARRRFTLA